MNKILVNIFRWVLVIPVAVLTHIVSYYLYLWFSDEANMQFFKYVEIFMAFAFSGALSIVAGSLTAPSHRNTVSIILCSIFCTLMIIGLFILIPKYSEYGIVSILGNIASIIGFVAGTYIIKEEL